MNQADDFLIVPRPRTSPRSFRGANWFALVGPGLDAEGIPFASFSEAEARGRAIARSSGASLWDGTVTPAVLVATFQSHVAQPSGDSVGATRTAPR